MVHAIEAVPFGRISKLAIYPVKSGGRVEVSEAQVSSIGLEVDGFMDRQFMVVRGQPDAEDVYSFVTQRDKRSRDEKQAQGLAVLALLKPELRKDGLRLTWNYKDPIDVPNEMARQKELRVRIFKNVVSALDQGEDLAEWLSRHLQTSARLVKAPGRFVRMSNQKYGENYNPLLFQDGYPLHWFMQESVNEVSRLARQEIPWTRFRPNIVGEGGEPQSEHIIYEGTFGNVPFLQPKPCERCPITTVDQETGEKKGNEPLGILSKYKRWKLTGQTILGENAIPLSNGRIKIGDEITIVSVRDPPLAY